MIREDIELPGVLEASHWSDLFDKVTHLYARVVMSHEGDPNCDLILEVFRQAGYRVPPAGTCA